MVATPPETPVTTPVVETVAMVELEELQVPPVVELLNVMLAPRQTEPAPEMAAGVVGTVFTVSFLVTTAAPQLLDKL